ncbi:hypothetical protein [Colwellia sp. 12G3]|nr:hypothetical protein [Colwellia sp. 12G3]
MTEMTEKATIGAKEMNSHFDTLADININSFFHLFAVFRKRRFTSTLTDN